MRLNYYTTTEKKCQVSEKIFHLIVNTLQLYLFYQGNIYGLIQSYFENETICLFKITILYRYKKPYSDTDIQKKVYIYEVRNYFTSLKIL